MTFEQLLYAEVLSHHPSMQEAADLLHISKSGLSLAMKQLEDELGIKLFNRTAKGTFVTEDGIRIINDLTKVLKARNDLLSTAKQISEKTLRSSLKLGIMDYLRERMNEQEIVKIQDRFPNLTLRLQVGKVKDLTDQVRNRELDAAYIILPQQVSDLGEDINFKYVKHGRIRLACQKGCRLAKTDQLTFDQLKDCVFSIYEDETILYLFRELQYMAGALECRVLTNDLRLIDESIRHQNMVTLIFQEENDAEKEEWAYLSIGHLIDDHVATAVIYNENVQLSANADTAITELFS